MATGFEPRLTSLPEQQRRLWPELEAIPSTFVLFGGTAIALQLAHRASLDFDFMVQDEFDPDELYVRIPFLAGSKQIQKSASTLTCIVERDGPVQLSFFGAPNIQLIKSPLTARDTGVRIASLLDLVGMKAAVVQKRPEAKDYIDIDAIIQQGSISLSTALAAAKKLYTTAFNPILTLKSLSYFGDGNLPTLPGEIKDRLIAAVQSVDLNQLPDIGHCESHSN